MIIFCVDIFVGTCVWNGVQPNYLILYEELSVTDMWLLVWNWKVVEGRLIYTPGIFWKNIQSIEIYFWFARQNKLK